MPRNLQLVILTLALTNASLLYAQKNDTDAETVNTPEKISVPARVGSSPARLLNLDEGLAVLGAAMETAHHRTLRQDCSHFVNEIYERAGFPYSYENSVALYDGTGDFQRVTHPQPGDLIVWRGHMGIIVNPVQRSFFSSLRTGFGVEKYDSRYWRRRGHPRFFRYVKTADSGLTLASAKVKATDEIAGTSEPSVAAPQPAPMVEPSQPVGGMVDTAAMLPQVVSADSATSRALQQALEDKFSDANASLGNVDLLNSAKTVVIVENFQVKKVHVKRDQGWAEVQMNEPSSMEGGQTNLQRRSEKQRWPLYRSGKQWQLELPTNVIYLPKDTAVRLVAHELATMTGRSHSTPPYATQQEAQLARLLDRLLGE